jgi:hypothetical protein
MNEKRRSEHIIVKNLITMKHERHEGIFLLVANQILQIQRCLIGAIQHNECKVTIRLRINN